MVVMMQNFDSVVKLAKKYSEKLVSFSCYRITEKESCERCTETIGILTFS
jgi:7-cyano-7-deazaguanine synthase in queuosine biosynthesis